MNISKILSGEEKEAIRKAIEMEIYKLNAVFRYRLDPGIIKLYASVLLEVVPGITVDAVRKIIREYLLGYADWNEDIGVRNIIDKLRKSKRKQSN